MDHDGYMKAPSHVCQQVMAIITDFKLVWLPASTVSLHPPLAISAGPLAKFFYGCPTMHSRDHRGMSLVICTGLLIKARVLVLIQLAFSDSIMQHNGAKQFAVGTSASLGFEKSLLKHIHIYYKLLANFSHQPFNPFSVYYKFAQTTFAGKAEDMPIISTRIAYGGYQVLARVIEQRILEPLLHQHKPISSAICFTIRTGNTFLGSLMRVDYAQWGGIQKIRE
ncbi:hypothetical protein RJ641_004994 [Dillenia turbinata]|uniref:Uncharacterized protein n=1 Tax=Dillenia turbinata TaxID=194707 RepID=A0AAN8VC02_9MAGN